MRRFLWWYRQPHIALDYTRGWWFSRSRVTLLREEWQTWTLDWRWRDPLCIYIEEWLVRDAGATASTTGREQRMFAPWFVVKLLRAVWQCRIQRQLLPEARALDPQRRGPYR